MEVMGRVQETLPEETWLPIAMKTLGGFLDEDRLCFLAMTWVRENDCHQDTFWGDVMEIIDAECIDRRLVCRGQQRPRLM